MTTLFRIKPIQFLVLTLALTLSSASAFSQQHPRLIAITPEKVFIPYGFDSNDNVQVVVHGHIPSTCHKLHSSSGWLENGQIHVKVMAYQYFGQKCLDVASEYNQTIDIGLIPTGNYNVVVETEEAFAKVGTLDISNAKSTEKDDFIYANVTDAEYVATGDGVRKLVLHGTYKDTCSKIAQVQMYYQNDVLVVLPLLEVAAMDTNCLPVVREFSEEVVIGPGLNMGSNLMHIRSSNGQAVNKHFIVGRD